MTMIGQIRVDPIIDGTCRFPSREAYPNAGEALFAEHARWFDHEGVLELPLGGFLIRTSGRVIVVDTGAGPFERDWISAGRFIHSLAGLGVRVEDVTDVVHSHLHWDHVGWSTQKGAVVFGSATYRCSGADWEHFMCDDRAARKLGPLGDRLQTWDGAVTIVPGMDTLPTPGHTPGHAAFVLSSGAERAIILGDVAHCPIELTEPEFEGISDVDPALANATRESIARMLESSGAPATAPHFPRLEFGRLMRAEGKRSWVV